MKLKQAQALMADGRNRRVILRALAQWYVNSARKSNLPIEDDPCMWDEVLDNAGADLMVQMEHELSRGR